MADLPLCSALEHRRVARPRLLQTHRQARLRRRDARPEGEKILNSALKSVLTLAGERGIIPWFSISTLIESDLILSIYQLIVLTLRVMGWA